MYIIYQNIVSQSSPFRNVIVMYFIVLSQIDTDPEACIINASDISCTGKGPERREVRGVHTVNTDAMVSAELPKLTKSTFPTS
jgi:hypothetical protein